MKLLGMLVVLGVFPALAGCTQPTSSNPSIAESAAATSSICTDNDLSSAKGKDGTGVLTIGREGNTSFTRNFNPFSPSNLWGTAWVMYEPLLAYNRGTGETVPRLATKWGLSNDASSVTFTLRPDVKWSDGTAFTSADVKFTLDFMRKSFGAFSQVKQVATPNDHEVVVTFDGPFSPGLENVGSQLIVPEHIWSKVPDPLKFTNENPVATGPFTVVSNFNLQSYELDRNMDYWGGPAHIKGIRIPAYATNTQVGLALAKGEIDWADIQMPDPARTFVRRDSARRCFWFPSISGVANLIPNTTKAPLDDPNVRRAISIALDRKSLISTGLDSQAGLTDGTAIGPRYPSWIVDDGKQTSLVTQDVKEANSLLDAAGLKKGPDGIRTMPDGSPINLSIMTGQASTQWVTASKVISRQLENNVGLKVDVESPDWGAVISRATAGDFSMALMWESESNSPYSVYRGLMSSATWNPIDKPSNENWQRVKDPETDALLAKFVGSADHKVQQEAVNDMAKRYVAVVPTIPLFDILEFGEYNTTNFVGFPDAKNAYADPNTRSFMSYLVFTTVRPRG